VRTLPSLKVRSEVCTGTLDPVKETPDVENRLFIEVTNSR
jgi:hypothetical protein